MYSFESIDIMGYDGKSVPNTYLKLKAPSEKLAIVFPGRGYTSQGPLLHYTINLLLENRINVLSVDYNYMNNPEFNGLEWEKKQEWLFADVEEAFKVATDSIDAEIRILVGKSLGTLAIGHLLDTFSSTRKNTAIWHTPLVKMPHLVRQITKHKPHSLFVIGTSDPHYEKEVLDEVKGATNGKLIVIEGANHSMEVSGGVEDSLEVMTEIVGGIRQFLWPVDK
jgi:hypothetical protein